MTQLNQIRTDGILRVSSLLSFHPSTHSQARYFKLREYKTSTLTDDLDIPLPSSTRDNTFLLFLPCPCSGHYNVGSSPHLARLSLIDLLHVGSVVTVLDQSWGRILSGSSGGILDHRLVLIDTESQLDHAVDAAGVLLGHLQSESGRQQRGLVQQDDQILDGLVVLVSLHLLAQSLDDGVVGVDLQVLLSGHVSHHVRVTQGLSLMRENRQKD